MLDDSYLLREHPKFFKIDEAINLSLVAIIEKCQVFLENWEERDERGCGASLEFTVLGHIVEWVHETSEVVHGLAILGGHLLPRRSLPLNKAMV